MDLSDGAAVVVVSLNGVFGGVSVHHPADRAADLVVDAGLAAGANGDERLLRLRDRGAAGQQRRHRKAERSRSYIREFHRSFTPVLQACEIVVAAADRGSGSRRSEEHTSELQALMRISYAVFCLKKKIL